MKIVERSSETLYLTQEKIIEKRGNVCAVNLIKPIAAPVALLLI